MSELSEHKQTLNTRFSFGSFQSTVDLLVKSHACAEENPRPGLYIQGQSVVQERPGEKRFKCRGTGEQECED